MLKSKRALLAFLWIPVALLLIGSSGRISPDGQGPSTGQGVPVSTGNPPPPPTTGSSSTATTATSATTATTGTTGTTVSTTGSGQFSGIVYLQQLYELKSTPTVYKKVGSAVTSLSNQHVVLVKVVLPSVTVSPPYELVGVGWDVTAFGDAVLAGRSDGGAAPVYQASVPKSGTPNQQFEAGITYQGITAPGHILVGLASGAALSGGDVRLSFHKEVQTRVWQNGQWVYGTSHTYTYVDLDLAKLGCGDASVDSRKAYGQPNLAGELPGDPNAPPRPINFGGWVYKGGLFVGNMPAATRDQSGMARLQLYVPSGGSGAVRLATLSLFDLASPSIAPGAIVGAYLPSATDTNLSVGAGAVTWDTKWGSVQPRATPSSPPDDARDPLVSMTLTGTGSEYRNFPLNRNDAVPASMALSKICLALTDEDPNDGPYWRYFGSSTYQGSHSTFPLNDCGPRVWRLGEESAVQW
ncbi:MAG: hypothetical protein ACO1SV_08115 [Fimbriimonas sp.]